MCLPWQYWCTVSHFQKFKMKRNPRKVRSIDQLFFSEEPLVSQFYSLNGPKLFASPLGRRWSSILPSLLQLVAIFRSATTGTWSQQRSKLCNEYLRSAVDAR